MSGKTDINQLHINCTNCTMTAGVTRKQICGQPNAFGGTFVFFSTHRPTLKKFKRATKQPHQDTATMGRHSTTEKEQRRHNSTYKKLAVQWLNKHLCFVSGSVLADSLVLRNRQLLVAAKRYREL